MSNDPVVINKSGRHLNGGANLAQKTKNGTALTYPQFPPDEPVTLPAQYLGWSLNLDVPGFVIQPEGAQSAVLKPGQTYTIELDTKAPPLSDEAFLRAYALVASAFEFGGRVPPGEGEHDSLWSWVCVRLGRPAQQAQAVYQMLKYELSRFERPVGWLDLYATFEDRQRPASMPAAAVAERVRTHQADVVLYLRSLDTFPGGNADMSVIKVTFLAGGGITAMVHTNWDGSHHHTDSAFALEPEAVDENLREDLLQGLLEVIETHGAQNNLVSVRYDANENDYQTHIWSSIEVLVYADEGALVYRIHERHPITQKELKVPIEKDPLGLEWEDTGDFDPPLIRSNTSPAVRAFLAQLIHNLRVSKPGYQAPEEILDVRVDLDDEPARYLGDFSDVYAMPVYLTPWR